MVIRRVVAPRIDFGPLRRELGLPERFPPAAQREADEVAAALGHQATYPAAHRATDRRAVDRTDIPLVTVDPAESRDLDQAMCLRRRAGGGYRVLYAIADLSAYVAPGGELERETWRRGETVYLPDGNVPLHPRELSEGAASLLPDVERRAVLWTIDLDTDGATTDVRLERAVVRSRAKLDYIGVQAAFDTGRAAEPIALLPEIGALLRDRGIARGAINLPLPEQEVEPAGDGWRLVLRPPVQAEDHNAQISLLTGMAAAAIMIKGGVGLLRTMAAPDPQAVQRLRVAATGLGVDWPANAQLGQVLTTVEPAHPRHAAFLDQAAELLRNARYTAFDGAVPDDPEHGGVAAPYAHVTAPLRRLADRYATEVCLALHAGEPVPNGVREALPRLPDVMAGSDRLASAAERGAIELAEAVLLSGRVGETFEATVLDVDAPPKDSSNSRQPGGMVALDDPPVRARCEGDLPLGERVPVRLMTADPTARRVLFAVPA
ncbi:MAG TPA: RNB domain-containing ribonuclease [Micromonosporaceae bacterium]